MYRTQPSLQVFLVHPGGPFFKKKDKGWWTIPKGLPETGEDLLRAAQREFQEETGIPVSEPLLPLKSVKQKGGKIVHAWAFKGNWVEEDGLNCNMFMLEWPPNSGKMQSFAEVDKARWFSIEEATEYINAAQIKFLERLVKIMDNRP